jgi:hypothetical protein
VIPSAPINQPLVSGGHSAALGFGPSAGGGRIAVAPGSVLRLTAPPDVATVQSDVILAGQTTACTTCTVAAEQIGINMGATLTLDKGVKVSAGMLGVGFNNSHGTLRTWGGTVQSEWPVIDAVGLTNTPGNGISVMGTPGNYSVLDIDGLKILNVNPNEPGRELRMIDYYHIARVAGLLLDAPSAPQRPQIELIECANATDSGQLWTVKFADSYGPGGFNISVPNCYFPLGIQIQPFAGPDGGPGYGFGFSFDPFGTLSWY